MTVGLPDVPPAPPQMYQFLLALRSRLLSTSSGTSVGATTSSSGNYHATAGGKVASLADYGAACDFNAMTLTGTDDTAAWNAAIADLNAGVINAIFIPGLSAVSGALTPVVGTEAPFSIYGTGVRTSGIVQTANLDVTTLDITTTGFNGHVNLHDFGFLNTQKNGQALRLFFNAAVNSDLRNLEVSGAPSRVSGGFNRGIELDGMTTGRCFNVVVHGWKTSNADPYPQRWQNSDWGWYIHDSLGQAAEAITWMGCDTLYCKIGWKVDGHPEGLFWTNSNAVWCGTGWSVKGTTFTQPPQFAWYGCCADIFGMGWDLDSLANVRITDCLILQEGYINTNRTTISVVGCTDVVVAHTSMYTEFYTTGSDHFLYVSNSTNVTSDGNLIVGLTGTGIGVKFTGTSSNCHTRHDTVSFPATTAAVWVNDSSNALTNTRRAMKLLGVTDAQGKQTNSAAMATATALTTSQVIYVQVPFGVTIGDRLRFSLFALATTSAAANDSVFLTLREFTHRAAAAVPFQILKFGTTQRQYFDTKWVNTAVQADAHFTPTFEVDVIATAGDALFTVEVKHTANCTLGVCELLVERV